MHSPAPLDPTIYQLAEQPWPYGSLAGIMKSWGYAPVGDHSPEHRLNPEGFLVWEKTDAKTGEKRAFVVSNPRWRAHGWPEPVWPAARIMRALRAQEVYHRFGSDDIDPDCDVISLTRKPHAKRGSRGKD
jgi:hypothetical protein